MRLEGANASARIEGEDKLPGVVNYFIGDDSSHWRAGIPTYARVRYRQIYPGIDLVYYGNQRQLECDLNLAPGAKPDEIRLSFRGADHLEIDRDGDLVVGASRGRIVIHRPVAYQEFGGARRKVASSYKMLGRSRVGVEVASYDRMLLPDPLGPIKPRISPSRTSKDTLLTARKPPKRFDRPASASIYAFMA